MYKVHKNVRHVNYVHVIVLATNTSCGSPRNVCMYV